MKNLDVDVNTNPKVTVLLPFFNAEATLERAITSIAHQTFNDFECILIDNNSTDLGTDIAAGWLKKDKRFILISEKKQGPAWASNTGYEASIGRYIARMDADDWSYPDRLEKQVKFLDEHPDFGAVGGLVEHVGHSELTKGFERYVSWSNSIRDYHDISNRRFIELPVVNPSAMWRREVVEEYGLYRSGDFPEDYEMWLRWLGAGVKVHKLSEVVLKWYDSDHRLTRNHSSYRDKAFYEIKSKFLAEWLAKHNQHHPEVAIWGASRISRRRARMLLTYGIDICCYIDIKRSRDLDKPVLYYSEIPDPEKIFILTYIKQMNARDEIQSFLHSRGFIEGKNYLLIS